MADVTAARVRSRERFAERCTMADVTAARMKNEDETAEVYNG